MSTQGEKTEKGDDDGSASVQEGQRWTLERQTGWNKQPPAPALPPEVVQKTHEKYREAYERLTGMTFPYDL